MPDFMDINGLGSDSHLQFLNWTVDSNGAWDYAADTRGYTYGFVTEYDDVDWSARYVLALMPTVANGVDLEWNLRRARGDNFELESRRLPLDHLLPAERKGTIRLLGFVNHANMGNYRVQNSMALLAQRARRERRTRLPSSPTIPSRRPQVRRRPQLRAGVDGKPSALSAASRLERGGRSNESYAYTEADQTFDVLGADLAGKGWGGPRE